MSVVTNGSEQLGTTDTPGTGGMAFQDLPQGHWAQEAIYRLADKGIVSGDAGADTIRPEADITREETVKVLLGAMGISPAPVAGNTPEGVSGWAKDYMVAAQNRGIIQGDETGALHGQDSITRIDAMVMIARAVSASGGSEQDLAAFADQAAIPGYARQAVADLVHMGVVSGYEDGTIGAGRTITRAELFVLVDRAMNEK